MVALAPRSLQSEGCSVACSLCPSAGPFLALEPTVCLFKDPESPTGNSSTCVRSPSFLIRLAHLCASEYLQRRERSAISLPSLLFLVSVVAPQHFCLCVLLKEQLGRAGGGYRPRLSCDNIQFSLGCMAMSLEEGSDVVEGVG